MANNESLRASNEEVVRRGYPFPLQLVDQERNTTNTNLRMLYALRSSVHGKQFPHHAPWGDHGRIPFCQEGAWGERNSVTHELTKEGCLFACCRVKPGDPNTIAAGPGEYSSSKKSKDHLQLVHEEHSYYGGSQLACTTGICNPANQMKPKDCIWYPFFIVISAEGKLTTQRGKKCPMQDVGTTLDFFLTLKDVYSTIKMDPQWEVFLQNAYRGMYGYGAYDYGFLDDVSVEQLDRLAEEIIGHNKEQEIMRAKIDLDIGNLELSDIEMEVLIDPYVDDLRKFKESALDIFKQLINMNIRFREGINIHDLNFQ